MMHQFRISPDSPTVEYYAGGEWFEIPELTAKNTQELLTLVIKLKEDIKLSLLGIEPETVDYSDEDVEEEEDSGIVDQEVFPFTPDSIGVEEDDEELCFDGYDDSTDTVIDTYEFMNR